MVTVPYPRAVIMDGQRLPASYANFYIANGVVIVPTFNDANDRQALATLAECFPDRRVDRHSRRRPGVGTGHAALSQSATAGGKTGTIDMSTYHEGGPEQPSPSQQSGNGEEQRAPVPEPELPRWATKAQVATPFSDARMAAYIGPRWESSYRQKLAGFFADPAFSVSWNWAAFFVGPMWFLYRKLYLAFGIFWVASQVLGARVLAGIDRESLSAEALSTPEGKPILMMLAGIYLTIHLASAGTANWLLFRRARAATLIVTIQQVPEDVAISRLQRLGGVAALPVVLLLLLTAALAIAAAMAPAK